MNYCKNCGTPISDMDMKCRTCGKSVVYDKSDFAKKTVKYKKKAIGNCIGWLCGVVFLAVVFAGTMELDLLSDPVVGSALILSIVTICVSESLYKKKIKALKKCYEESRDEEKEADSGTDIPSVDSEKPKTKKTEPEKTEPEKSGTGVKGTPGTKSGSGIKGPKNPPPPEKKPEIPKESVVFYKRRDLYGASDWICGYCDIVNKSHNSSCELCGSARKSYHAARGR